VTGQEVLFKSPNDNDRMRHIVPGPDGAMYVLFRDRVARLSVTP
jgi:hypothetical protein